MLWVVPLLFGIGCAVAGRSALRSGDTGAQIIAGYLTVIWALANAAWLSNMMWLLPMLDLWLGIAALTIWWATQARWVALIVNAVAARFIFHILDVLTWHAFEVPYIHALNAAFAWMLYVVASSGGDHVRDTLLRRFRRIRGVLSPASARGLTDGR